MKIKANNPELKSWVDVSKDSDFSIQNLPFGIFSDNNKQKRVGVAIGDYILDLSLTQKLGYITDLPFLQSDFEKCPFTLYPPWSRGLWCNLVQFAQSVHQEIQISFHRALYAVDVRVAPCRKGHRYNPGWRLQKPHTFPDWKMHVKANYVVRVERWKLLGQLD